MPYYELGLITQEQTGAGQAFDVVERIERKGDAVCGEYDGPCRVDVQLNRAFSEQPDDRSLYVSATVYASDEDRAVMLALLRANAMVRAVAFPERPKPFEVDIVLDVADACELGDPEDYDS